SFSETLPERLQQLRPYALSLQPRPLQAAAISAVDSAISAVQSPQRPAQDQIVEAGATAAHTLFSLITVFVLAYYWLVERPSIKRVVLRAVSVRHARDVHTVWREVEEKLGGWVRGQLILMLAIGVMATVGYVVLGLPNPILLGILFGGVLAGLPGAFVAVPLAGALQVVLAHLLRSEDPSQAEEHRDPADRAAHQNPAAGAQSGVKFQRIHG